MYVRIQIALLYNTYLFSSLQPACDPELHPLRCETNIGKILENMVK